GPQIRIRVPGGWCFSTTSVGELKNTIESRSAPSTSAAAIASTPRLVPIRTSRRCLRVIPSRCGASSLNHYHWHDSRAYITPNRGGNEQDQMSREATKSLFVRRARLWARQTPLLRRP